MSRPTLTEFKKKALSKAAVNKEYKSLSPAYALRKKLIALRQKAGLTQEMNDVPEFFKNEASPPTNLKFEFSKEVLKSFWKKIDD